MPRKEIQSLSRRILLLLACVSGVLHASAQDVLFYRLASPGETAVLAFLPDGALTWTNTAPSGHVQVQRASPAVDDWRDYILVPATGVVQTARLHDPNPPAGMAFVPAGRFVMGAATNAGQEASSDEVPQHEVYIDACHVERHEVTKALWDEVRTWAATNGYAFENAGAGKGTNHPVHTINWYDAVKWCNARSEREGLDPCYTTNGAVYRTGSSVPDCDWLANGYRLPTEAEWEKAARGGEANHRFPWPDTETIQHARANFFSSTAYAYDTSPTRGFHPAYATGSPPYSSSAGSFPANAYGLCDMAGNMWEWCWDWYAAAYYSASPATDPHGAATGTERVLRGGSWIVNAFGTRAAVRTRNSPLTESNDYGFRCARGR